MSAMTPAVISAPGFYGLNTMDSATEMDAKFALDATNAVIDRSGRMSSRKGWTAQHTTLAALGSSNVDSMGEFISPTGTSTVVVAGNNKLFKFSGSTLTELTYGGGGVAPTITASNWQMCSLGNALLLFQSGNEPLIYDVALSTTQYRRLSEHPSYSGTAPQGNCAISAYGRVWVASTTTDKYTIKWSDTGLHYKWSGGSAGSLDLTTVWPAGSDEITALAAHNGNLIIFGKRQILIYTGATTPSTMTLSDTILNVGCVARDSVQNTGEDIVFLSDSGVRSLSRTIQEKSAPLSTLSKNVNDDILGYVGTVTAVDVKSVYSPADSFYVLAFRSSGLCYCFDTRVSLPDRSARITLWTGISPRSLLYTSNRQILIGKAGYVGLYSGYTDNGSIYRFSYYTPWLSFTQTSRLNILKRINLILQGAQSQDVVVKWGFDYVPGSKQTTIELGSLSVAEYGTAEYGEDEYSANLLLNSVGIPAAGSGKVIQIGFEANMTTYSIAIQRVEIHSKEGRF